MARLFPVPLLLAVIGVSLATIPARAQFGTIFGNNPPRPPQSVPDQRDPWELTPPPQQRPSLPPPEAQQRPQGGIQSQPLPPPPGSPAAPITPQQQPALSGLPPGQRQPAAPIQPADSAPQPGDETIVEPPEHKIENPTGVFAGLDKITGRITSFDAAIGETVQFGALQVTPRACYTRPPTETPRTDAFIEVDEVTLQGEIRRIYTGWMFAASPGLHAVEHPIYDVWLTDCKGGAVAEAEPQEAPPLRASRNPSAQPQQRIPR